jgi:hypothetical protein
MFTSLTRRAAFVALSLAALTGSALSQGLPSANVTIIHGIRGRI